MGKKFKCPKCGEEIISQYLRIGEKTNCPKCGEVIFVPEDAVETLVKNALDVLKDKYMQKMGTSENRDKRLKILIETAKITGLVYFLYFCFWTALFVAPFPTPDWLSSFLNIFGPLIKGFVFLLLMLFLAEGVQIFLNIEKNTRNTLTMLDKYLRDDKKKE